MRPTLVYMSSVVFAELYAGAKDRFTIRQLERVYRIFARLDRLAIPDKQVWFETRQVLQQLGARHGFETIGLSPITHDVLIALTARARNHRLQPKLQRLRAHSRDKRFSSESATTSSGDGVSLQGPECANDHASALWSADRK